MSIPTPSTARLPAARARRPTISSHGVAALERELTDVEGEFAALQASDLKPLNGALQRRGKPVIDVAAVSFIPDHARGGRIEALASGPLGTRFLGIAATLTPAGERD